MLKKPVWRMAEDDDQDGAGDDGAEEDEQEQEGDEPDDSGDDSSDDLPDKAKAALDRMKVERAELRKQLRDARQAAKKDEDTDEKVAAVEAKWKPRVVNSAARAALLEAGADKPERLLKLLDHDELDVTDRGTVDGLDDEVERLREEYPELFTTKRRGTRLETGDRSSGTGTKRTKTASERQADSILRGGR